MDTPENYYAILGVPINADGDMLKRAYRQLARRFHPDLAGPEGALEMKRINRAYAVLSDPEQRQHYDTVLGGVVDLRRHGFVRPRPRPGRGEDSDDFEFADLNIFSTKGPFQAGPVIHSSIGIISSLTSIRTVPGLLIAAGSLDGKGMTWQLVNGEVTAAMNFATDPDLTLESLRELRISEGGALLAGWGRLGLHVWDACDGSLLWSASLLQRAVADHYSIDMQLQVMPTGKRLVAVALPHLTEDARAPRAWGVRGTDVVRREIGTPAGVLSEPLLCTEEGLEKRNFWAIRMRSLSQDQQALITLSCAQVPREQQQMAVVRRWNLTSRARLSNKLQPQISTSILVGGCEDCRPPYAITPDARTIAFVYAGNKIRLCDTTNGTYSEILSGVMGGNSRLAISSDGQWLALAREDSDVNEGVIDLWSIATGQILQKFYHPWQISALHFADRQLVVAQTDGTIQVWQ
jgi:WD40 repeat protein